MNKNLFHKVRLCLRKYNHTIIITGIFLLFVLNITAATPAVPRTPKWTVFKIVLRADPGAKNPFDDIQFTATVVDPNGNNRTVEGFYDGDGNGAQTGNVWEIRFSPDSTGVWKWITHSNLPELNERHGRFECVAGTHSGPIVATGNHFRYADGAPVYLLGNFLDFRSPAHQRFSHTLLSENISEADRQNMIHRALTIHHANKMNIYLANCGDYHALATTPWLGTAYKNNKSRFDMARWKMFDRIVEQLDRVNIIAELWFFADDSDFGKLSKKDRERLIRYGMARLSAYPNTMFVLCLEWQEGWSRGMVASDIIFGQLHNPWKRLWSVHGVNGDFAFPKQPWIDFMITQPGNDIRPAACNLHTQNNCKIGKLPLIVEEFGHALPKTRRRLRGNLWAAFCGGAAGSGTGCDLARLRSFIDNEKIPFWKMSPNNNVVSNGFALLEYGCEYVIYVQNGGKTAVQLPNGRYNMSWISPRNEDMQEQVKYRIIQVTSKRHIFTAPSTNDWVLHLRREK